MLSSVHGTLQVDNYLYRIASHNQHHYKPMPTIIAPASKRCRFNGHCKKHFACHRPELHRPDDQQLYLREALPQSVEHLHHLGVSFYFPTPVRDVKQGRATIMARLYQAFKIVQGTITRHNLQTEILHN